MVGFEIPLFKFGQSAVPRAKASTGRARDLWTAEMDRWYDHPDGSIRRRASRKQMQEDGIKG